MESHCVLEGGAAAGSSGAGSSAAAAGRTTATDVEAGRVAVEVGSAAVVSGTAADADVGSPAAEAGMAADGSFLAGSAVGWDAGMEQDDGRMALVAAAAAPSAAVMTAADALSSVSCLPSGILPSVGASSSAGRPAGLLQAGGHP